MIDIQFKLVQAQKKNLLAHISCKVKGALYMLDPCVQAMLPSVCGDTCLPSIQYYVYGNDSRIYISSSNLPLGSQLDIPI